MPSLLPREVATVELQPDGRLRVMMAAHPYGMPHRPRRPPAVHLEDGQWLRWQINYRFSSAAGRGDWMYCLQTLNVGCGVADGDVSLGTPGRVIDERAQLA